MEMWLRNMYLLCIILLFAYTLIAKPIPANGKSELVDKNKVNTRHEHKNNNDCQYIKGAWSECSLATNTKARTLTLKKGQDDNKCEKTKAIEKKCRKSKSCKYDKGSWSRCNANNEMTRTDVLKNANEMDASCEKSKIITKTCKGKTDHSNKGAQKRKHKQQEQANGKNKKEN